jgi:hypothetical protein
VKPTACSFQGKYYWDTEISCAGLSLYLNHVYVYYKILKFIAGHLQGESSVVDIKLIQNTTETNHQIMHEYGLSQFKYHPFLNLSCLWQDPFK